jgi:hypothetical protein
MDVRVLETTLSMALLQVPDGLEGEELQAAVEAAKEKHDNKGGGYSWMETVTWTWDKD